MRTIREFYEDVTGKTRVNYNAVVQQNKEYKNQPPAYYITPPKKVMVFLENEFKEYINNEIREKWKHILDKYILDHITKMAYTHAQNDVWAYADMSAQTVKLEFDMVIKKSVEHIHIPTDVLHSNKYAYDDSIQHISTRK